ncbi:MAG: NADH-quinone oxidoreductase subunit M [Roseiflexaceae bacterium]|nr:NADH-quinone oxidoreductase subunit M [Roseiflexaceae bacterium]
MTSLGFPLISIALLLPLVGALVLLFVPKQQTSRIRMLAFSFGMATLMVALLIAAYFNTAAAGFQLVDTFDWIPGLGLRYTVSVDGVSLWFFVLAALLTPIAQLASWSLVEHDVRAFQALLLVLSTAVLGTFVAQDMVLFYIFFELTLVPTALLIGRWGGANRTKAASQFFLYNFGASLFMLVAIIALYFANRDASGVATADIGTLLTNIQDGTLALDPALERLIFGGFFLAFAVKLPLWPFHTWLPLSHAESTDDGSIDLIGLLQKTAGYGMIRFCVQLLPAAAAWAAPAIGVLAVISILYGALVAYGQNDIKRVLAFSTLSHMGFAVLGIFALNELGISGAIMMMIASGIATGALFLASGMIVARRGTRDIRELGGIWQPMPILGGLVLTAIFGSIGLPGLIGFAGEFTVMQGAWSSATLGPGFLLVAVFGVILAAGYLLTMYQRAFMGELKPLNAELPDLAGREIALLGLLVLLIVGLGIVPNALFGPMQATLQQIAASAAQLALR